MHPALLVGHASLRSFLLALLAAAALSACALPPLEPRTASSAMTAQQAEGTRLARAVASRTAEHPGLTGIDPLPDPRAAFAARVALARAAERTLDIQYYIWHDDLTGTLLLEEVHAAADRGVRVRLLLDDNGVPASLDRTLAALDAHPNVEVRLFNPFMIRHPKALGYLVDFARLNRRMHNKSFTADSTASIVGGRNVGDEYFGATDGVVFADLDVLAIGPVAEDVGHDFDRYWASASAYPASRILKSASPAELDALKARAEAIENDPAAIAYKEAILATPDVRRLLDGTLELEWAKTRIVSDDPAKTLGKAPPEGLLLAQLHDILGDPKRELDLVSPYFVPAKSGTQYFTQLAKSGVTVRVLTNALEATDVAAVHSGYARRRKDLLEAGVDLYELRRRARPAKDAPGGGGSSIGSSGSSLHAKTFAVDAERVFIGSLNFDPRSANLNTELGFVVDSPVLASRIESTFAMAVPQVAYQVRLDDQGKLFWIERNGEAVVVHHSEPNTTWAGRLGVWFFSILPIEWLL